MRPRPEGRGNLVRTQLSGRPRSCFNEAATRRSRKSGDSLANRRAELRFNEAATRRSRKSADVATRATAFFASMRPRPEGRGNITADDMDRGGMDASMRPRPEGRGNWRAELAGVDRRGSFNEAATRRSRK